MERKEEEMEKVKMMVLAEVVVVDVEVKRGLIKEEGEKG